MSSTAAPPADLRILTANVRIPVDAGDAAWTARRRLLAETLRAADADAIGVQELKAAPAADLLAALPEFRMLGRDRFGHEGAEADDEHSAILYRPDRLDLLEHGDFWLSDTPDVPASITWGTLFPRMVTWARFRHRGSGRAFLHANTHLPYRPVEDERARELGAALFVDRLPGIAGDLPIVLTGDFNTTPASRAHGILTGVLADAREAAGAVHSGPDGTFHDFTGEPGDRIDWIATRGFVAVATTTIDARDGTVWPSDHFPVLAELVFADPSSA